jgi:hypothetical protein
VQQIEVGGEVVRIVYRITPASFTKAGAAGISQDCHERSGAGRG